MPPAKRAQTRGQIRLTAWAKAASVRRRFARRPKPDTTDLRKGLWWRPAILVAAVMVTYVNSLSGPFILDDRASVIDNLQIREWWRLGGVLFPERDSSVAGRPLVNLSLAINYASGGLDVRGYHIWNIAVHTCCALLLFGIARRTFELSSLRARFESNAPPLAFAAALIWALHPLNTEAVDYLIQRTESMMALFYLLTLYASIRALSPTPVAAGEPGRSVSGSMRSEGRSPASDFGRRRRSLWQAGASVSCLLGVACKESMVTAPLMILLYDRLFAFESFRDALERRWRLYLALALTWVPAAALIASGPRVQAVGFSAGVSSWTYLLNQALIIPHYLRLTIWPRSLVVFYGWPIALTFADAAGQVLLMAALVFATLVLLARGSILAFPATWFFVTLAPSSSVIPIATEVGAERRMYLPLMAVAALVPIVCSLAARRAGAAGRLARIGATLMLGIVAAALSAATVVRNREYGSAVTLARTVVARRPTSVAHHILGEELMLAGNHDEAIVHLREAIGGDSRAHFPLGLELFNQGRFEEAVDELRAFVATWRLPHRLVPHWLEPSDSEAMAAKTTIGLALARLQRWPEVVDEARAILEVNPSHADARGLLADALLAEEKLEEATSHYREYLKLRPNDAAALTRLGSALASTGNLDEALGTFRRAVEIDPQNGDMQQNLAMALFDHRDVGEAADRARAAVRLKPSGSAAHDLLGRILAVQGRLDEATVEIERALQLDPANEQARDDLRHVRQARGGRSSPQ